MFLRPAKDEGGDDGVFAFVFAVHPEGAGIDGGAVDWELIHAVVCVALRAHKGAVKFGEEDPSVLVPLVYFEPMFR